MYDPGVTPLVRVPFEDNSGAQRALDAGAEGIIFPYIEDTEAAHAAAISCRYPPEGIRSFGPYRAPYGADLPLANAELLCLVMIESVGGLRNINSITRTPGVDGVFVGPNDLSISLGGGPIMADLYAIDSPQSPVPASFQEALSSISATTKANGKFAGIQVANGLAAIQAAAAGFDYVGIGGDTSFLQAGGQAALAQVRKG
ncbi:MAG: aldolase/citrate lyase family protein [Verrucomicrobia bacterium]|nr:aldolase/citrate lyase family protein [Verrucomicrobiota bacterium]